MNLKHKEGCQMRMTIAIIGMAIVAGLLLVPVPVSAHHAFSAAFDENKPINLQGKVSEIKVFAYQAKSGESKCVGVFVEYLDGKKVFMGGSAPGANGQSSK